MDIMYESDEMIVGAPDHLSGTLLTFHNPYALSVDTVVIEDHTAPKTPNSICEHVTGAALAALGQVFMSVTPRGMHRNAFLRGPPLDEPLLRKLKFKRRPP